MAEKRRLLNEMDKCFKKVDEGFEIFDEIMSKMSEANSDNQREKFQDDLKKEIKKLQRLRDQIKGWQNSSEIKDKEKLSQYRKLIEQRMETFKDIERENKTKPHSKQGLSAEDKLDPKEKEKSDTIEWLNNQIRRIQDEIDRTESKLETMTTNEGGRKRGKNQDLKKSDKEIEELKKHLERVKFHLTNWEVVMRLITNEKLEISDVLTKLKEPIEMYIDALDPDSALNPESLDPEDIYEELNLGSFIPQLAGLSIGSIDDETKSIGENGGNHRSSPSGSPPPTAATITPKEVEETKQRHQSGSDGKTLLAKPIAVTPLKLMRLGSRISAESYSLSSPPPQTPPPPPSIPYNSIAAGTASATATKSSTTSALTTPVMSQQGIQISAFATGFVGCVNDESNTTLQPLSSIASVVVTPPIVSTELNSVLKKQIGEDLAVNSSTDVISSNTGKGVGDAVLATTQSSEEEVNQNFLRHELRQNVVTQPQTNALGSFGSSTAQVSRDVDVTYVSGAIGDVSAATLASVQQQNDDDINQNTLRQVLRMGQNAERNTQPQTTTIPPWLGASPLGMVQITGELETQLNMLEAALSRVPLQTDSEKPRNYLPKIPYPTPEYYPQVPPLNADTIEYYLRLAPETLFFIFYYMEGTRAQLLSARALKKLSWRFHTKYLMWFQRHEEPKQITDDFEQGTYVYFDFEKWAQRKKEQFTFEYKFLEDKEFE